VARALVPVGYAAGDVAQALVPAASAIMPTPAVVTPYSGTGTANQSEVFCPGTTSLIEVNRRFHL